ncbi:exonuclease SbcCD subunit D [Cohnella soli]|uniref:Nuclease SbcCD subunit D n=1 Tax=Cohnella soli TaxID=425005 RepID=A0ABW0HPS4_9BACL
MKFIHTADWHLGKLVQGVSMTEDQRYVLTQLVQTVEAEKPDMVVVAGDLYDRAIPPTEAALLLDELFERIVIGLNTPVLAISGNHDSPDRLSFGTEIMKSRGLHLVGQFKAECQSVVFKDEHGDVCFHLVPFADPAQVRFAYGDEMIKSHDDAMKAIVGRIEETMDPAARHVFVGHAFVTPGARPEENTSTSERPLSIGGAEYVNAAHFGKFAYVALGHLHQAHHVGDEKIRYSGSPLKYSISEESHRKGYLIVELGGDGAVTVEKRDFRPLRDMRRVAAPIEEIERHAPSDDYVFVTLLNDNPVLFPMEKVRAIYPNALHVERRMASAIKGSVENAEEERGSPSRRDADPVALFSAFYEEVKGIPLAEDKRALFADEFAKLLREEGGAV